MSEEELVYAQPLTPEDCGVTEGDIELLVLQARRTRQNPIEFVRKYLNIEREDAKRFVRGVPS